MRRRLEGYVVGRQTVQRQQGWKIRKRTRSGAHVDYFASEAQIADDFAIHAGAEVTFFADTRDGRIRALSVEPKQPAIMEDSMRKMHWGLIAALILAIIAVVGILKPHEYGPVRNWIVEIRAEWALDSIRELAGDETTGKITGKITGTTLEERADSALDIIRRTSANRIISDGVVRAAVRGTRDWGPGYRSASWAAREQIFTERQCHIFDIGYKDVAETCDTARYAEGRTEDNIWYERAGIPVSIAPVIAEMRKAIYRIGREFLRTPANVRALHEAKKAVIADEFSRLSPKNKQEFLVLLKDAVRAFEEFRTNEEVRKMYEEYISLEVTWSSSSKATTEPFVAWQDSGKNLETALGDTSMTVYLFAGRRYAEGGTELLDAYIASTWELYLSLLKQ